MRSIMNTQLTLLACSALALPARAQEAGDLGRIEFPNSGAPAAQTPFLRGVLLLHSFEYDDAAEAFRDAQAQDPGFTLAYWGEALTHCHPIWQEENRDAARDALAKLAPTAQERAAKTPTERERGFLAAVETLFGEGERATRMRIYCDAMARLHERYPEDMEVAAFHSLALLGTATDGRDVPIYMRAAAIAEEVLDRNPDHPGALHYAIHSYDDPVHAPLGLRMAHRYGVVAPAASHALHMPSHIYVALGLWDESAAANVASAAAADARRARKGLSIEARGYHSLVWLAYTYHQLGRVREATKLLDDMVRDEAESHSKRTRMHLAMMRAAHVIETQEWDSAIARLEVDTADLELAVGAAELWFRGFSAWKRGESERAAEVAEELARWIDEHTQVGGDSECCNAAANAYAPARDAARVMELELQGCLAFERDRERGLELLGQAGAAEDAMDYDFGPPSVVKPAHELLGEVLLALERPAEAVREFEAALARAPRRSASLSGLVRAAERAGDEAKAEASRTELSKIRKGADAPGAAVRPPSPGSPGPERSGGG